MDLWAALSDYDGLLSAAWEIFPDGIDEMRVLNLHNELVWHLYQPGKDADMDAILYARWEEIIYGQTTDHS